MLEKIVLIAALALIVYSVFDYRRTRLNHPLKADMHLALRITAVVLVLAFIALVKVFLTVIFVTAIIAIAVIGIHAIGKTPPIRRR